MARGNENVRKDKKRLCKIFKKITRSFGLPKKFLYKHQTKNESDVEPRQLIEKLEFLNKQLIEKFELLNKQLNEQQQQINNTRQAIENIPSVIMKLISDAQSDK
uniref:Uncharacterized protein n=1 Tax=Acrobeloides nanus TaxID=290746 RepID=A0A914CSZ0_9BILA